MGTNRLNRQYTDVLPTANLSLDITDAQKLRFAYNKAVARQDLPNLGRGLVSFYAVNGTPPRNPALPSDAVLFLNGRSGNPDLDPYRATNWNASWEWHFSDASLISVGAFLIDEKSFPTTVTNIEPQPDTDTDTTDIDIDGNTLPIGDNLQVPGQRGAVVPEGQAAGARGL